MSRGKRREVLHVCQTTFGCSRQYQGGVSTVDGLLDCLGNSLSPTNDGLTRD